jgi:2-oxoglutarate dehydrogenase E2 component (dihydrolipoamide succinyltransferase)
MAQTEVVLPKMGESVAEATITKWLKNVGDTIEAEESLVEIATDKVDSEVPSPASGVIVQRLFEEGAVVKVGEVIAIIAAAGAAPAPTPVPAAAAAPVASNGNGAAVYAEKAMEPLAAVADVARSGEGGRFYSPLVRTIAKAEGISIQELDRVAGTGSNGRVTKKDILAYLPNRRAAGAAAPTPVAAPAQQAAVVSAAPAVIKEVNVPVWPGDEIIEMDRMRKLIAEHMVMSKRTSPHVTSFVEADVTNVVKWREKVKKDFEKRENEKLTFTPIFIEAIVKAIKDFPMINISLSGDKIIKRKDINIGMATALPSGNLIVPVIKKADQLNLIGITKAVNDLANRARENKLSPDDIGTGTYTISNVGSFGNVMGTPVINQPQVAIMAVGAIRKMPAVIETEMGDVIAIRSKMFLSHSYDHRVVDGSLGGMFVRRVADYLEQWDINRTI